ncbi:unnamed protein product [Brassicogethes aeneus]|uniref:UDP-glucuronosyltransferase n=1 Tax=Brassicogethes aeneus TaxID=1431903 RepID=A0A9P0B5I9_BRAAE|nr:unnamed protein product [Brassicogethes aeneus]
MMHCTMRTGSVLIIFVAFLIALSKCSRLLIVFPMMAPSHYNLGSSLAKGLAEAGHDVTIIAPYKEKTIPKDWKYREIVLDGFLDRKEKEQINLFDFANTPPVITLFGMNGLGNEVTDLTFAHPNVQKLLKDKNEKFDSVIVEQFVNDAMKYFAYHFNAPLVSFSTVGANAWVNPLVGNPAPPSFVPEIFLSYSSRMSFVERLKNTLFSVISELNRHLIFFPAQNRILHKYYPDAPDLKDLLYNNSLILLNSHVSTNPPVPLLPNMIDIGGFHVKPAKTLPKDLKDFIEGAKHGVIYFSMGSNIRSKDFPEKMRTNLLNVLKSLKQRVIWKFEDENLPGKPDNVLISKWLPQNDILGHQNVKLFITHGGLLSTTETIYHGVPVLTIPIFGDQKMNAAQMVLQGFAQSIYFEDLNYENKIRNALNEVLTNPKYAGIAKQRSKIMHDQPLKPLDSAIFWIEYVIRHKGASHLRIAGLDLAWYQYISLDVYVFVSSVSILIALILVKLCKMICCKKTISKTDKVKKNK